MIPTSHVDILNKLSFAHVATTDSRGRPQSTVVWFDWDGERLRFSTTKARKKARNLADNPWISISIEDPNDPYRFIELRGSVTLDDDPDRYFIGEMSMKYRGTPFPDRPGEERLIVSLVPSKVIVYPAS